MIGRAEKESDRAGVSLRRMRMQALAPRIAFYVVIALLAVGGLRSAFGVSGESSQAAPVVEQRDEDIGAWSFAEDFAHVYLTWEAGDEGGRERQLAPFLSGGLEEDGGLQPAEGTSQRVSWTAVAGVESEGDLTNVVVAARTSEATVQLSVPVRRDDRGFLYVSGYPAIVGPPVVDETASPPSEQAVEDGKLETVVVRAVGNYLARSTRNLMADLTPGAVVSLPGETLETNGFGEVTWATPGRRVAVEVEVEDPRGNQLTLRYELGVRKLDRWYVSSLQVNPTFKGGQ